MQLRLRAVTAAIHLHIRPALGHKGQLMKTELMVQDRFYGIGNVRWAKRLAENNGWRVRTVVAHAGARRAA